MPDIPIDQPTYEKLRLLGSAWNVTDSEAVAELIARLSAGPSTDDAAGTVAIHAVYKGVRVEGLFDRQTSTVTITSGELAGRSFNSPSRAAREVVPTIDPDVNPHRNGWSFWIVTSTGKPLQSVRGS